MNEILDLSVKYGLTSSAASYVAVYNREHKVSGIMETVAVPVSNPAEWYAPVLFSQQIPCSEPRLPLYDMKTFENYNTFEDKMCTSVCDVFSFADIKVDGTDARRGADEDQRGIEHVLRILCQNQRADGAFGTRMLFETTVLALLLYALNTREFPQYAKQMEKACRYIFERLSQSDGPDLTDLQRSAAAAALCGLREKNLLKGWLKEAAHLKESFPDLNTDSAAALKNYLSSFTPASSETGSSSDNDLDVTVYSAALQIAERL